MSGQAEFEAKLRYFDQWIRQHGFDPHTGFNIDKNRPCKSFRRDILDEAMTGLADKVRGKTVEETVNSMPSLELNLDFPQERLELELDLFYLHENLTVLLNAYLKELRAKGIKEEEIIVPKQIGDPLIISSENLGMQYGLCTIINVYYELVDESIPLQDRETLEIDDVRFRWYFTENEE